MGLAAAASLTPNASDFGPLSQGSTPTPWAPGLRDQIQKWALQTQNALYFLGCARRGSYSAKGRVSAF